MDFDEIKKFFLHHSQWKLIKQNNKSNQIGFKCVINNKTFFEGHNSVSQCVLNDSYVGKHTYIGSGFLPNCKIGSFCSISYNVCVEPYRHNIYDCVSTFPGFYSFKKWPNNQTDFSDSITTDNGFFLEVGSDVFIGKNVIIKGGVSIGDGAVVGFGSVVTKNVPPYAVVAGNPARIIRYRFPNDIINKLEKIKWWEWEDKKIFENKRDFNNINDFIATFDTEQFDV